LLLQAISSIHITKDKFVFVPMQDFSEPWTDEKLYKKYGLTQDEIAFIESMIRPMEINT
jgi:site-specific DNA-methyltransferase (adenine-specific)